MPERTILDTIIDRKHEEVADRQTRTAQPEIVQAIADMPPARGFLKALQTVSTQNRMGLIAEVKKASPSAGIIRPNFDPVAIAKTYESNGATCLSVLTDVNFFQGHDDYLKAVRASVDIPLLRKDFTVDPYQIYETRLLGADAILLIVAALTSSQIREYQDIATGIGLDVLVEVHTEEEMQVAVDAGAKLVGINSRDLKRFVTDLAVFERLAPMAPSGSILVAESGIKTNADLTRVAAARANAILVGESLMRQEDIGAAVRELMGY